MSKGSILDYKMLKGHSNAQKAIGAAVRSGREWTKHKYINKVKTKSGKVRYIYDPTSSENSNIWFGGQNSVDRTVIDSKLVNRSLGKKYKPNPTLMDQAADFIARVADDLGVTRFRWDHFGLHKPSASSIRPSESWIGEMSAYSRKRR